jgi:hypothetical protein
MANQSVQTEHPPIPVDRLQTAELIYEAVVQITGTVEYGASMQALAAGKAAPPPERARFDVPFEGSINGPKLNGKAHGVDYLNIRADGRAELHIHAQVDLTDGGKVSFFADGIGTLDSKGIVHLRENVILKSNSPSHAWVNSIAVWGAGTINLATGEIRVKAYRA